MGRAYRAGGFSPPSEYLMQGVPDANQRSVCGGAQAPTNPQTVLFFTCKKLLKPALFSFVISRDFSRFCSWFVPGLLLVCFSQLCRLPAQLVHQPPFDILAALRAACPVVPMLTAQTRRRNHASYSQLAAVCGELRQPAAACGELPPNARRLAEHSVQKMSRPYRSSAPSIMASLRSTACSFPRRKTGHPAP